MALPQQCQDVLRFLKRLVHLRIELSYRILLLVVAVPQLAGQSGQESSAIRQLKHVVADRLHRCDVVRLHSSLDLF